MATWRTRFEELGDDLKVGISWRGGKDADVQRKRSTVLNQWEPLFALKGVTFVSLQYGETDQERQQCREHCGIELHDCVIIKLHHHGECSTAVS